MALTNAEQQFLSWFESVDPVAYEYVAKKSGAELEGWGWLATVGKAVVGAVKTVGPAVKEMAMSVAKQKAEEKLRKKFGIDQKTPVTAAQVSAQENQLKAISDKAKQEAAIVAQQIQAQADANQRILNENLRRMEQNQPPVKHTGYVPVINNNSVPRSTVDRVTTIAASKMQINTPLMIGGGLAALAAVFLYMKKGG